LNGLKAFEAAARHLSFTEAAKELHVTQAAISHQVKALEARLGTTLFHRRNRTLFLTDAGQGYLPPVRDALDAIADATHALTRRDRSGGLTVTTLHSFAVEWLMPRLRRFSARHPEIEVRLSARDQLIDLVREDVDMAIRYGRGVWPALRADRLMEEDVFPVCSPDLLAGEKPLATPADLANHTLIHDDMRESWRLWLLAAGVKGVDPERGPSFSHSTLVIQAAINGFGVALGRSALVRGDLAAGRLVRPFDVSMPAEFAYYVVYPEASARQPKVRAFRDWLLAEADADAAQQD
jgi:LysR family glycine cleavage system transcriptional activator